MDESEDNDSTGATGSNGSGGGNGNSGGTGDSAGSGPASIDSDEEEGAVGRGAVVGERRFSLDRADGTDGANPSRSGPSTSTSAAPPTASNASSAGGSGGGRSVVASPPAPEVRRRRRLARRGCPILLREIYPLEVVPVRLVWDTHEDPYG